MTAVGCCWMGKKKLVAGCAYIPGWIAIAGCEATVLAGVYWFKASFEDLLRGGACWRVEVVGAKEFL